MANASAHRERPQCGLSDSAAPQRGRDAVARRVRRGGLSRRFPHSLSPLALLLLRRRPLHASASAFDPLCLFLSFGFHSVPSFLVVARLRGGGCCRCGGSRWGVVFLLCCAPL